jgi:hypothetical protein
VINQSPLLLKFHKRWGIAVVGATVFSTIGAVTT